MADKVTSSAIDNLVQQLEKDADLPAELKDQVRTFQSELKRASSFLNYSDGANLKEQEVAQLATEIRDVACEAEDTIYALKLKLDQKRGQRVLERLRHPFGDGRYKLWSHATKRMNSMKQRLREICDGKNRDHRSTDGGSSHGSMTVEVVGFDDQAKKLVDTLTQGESQRTVVSIVGIDGLGKTTLAKKVYNSESVRNRFNNCRAWVHVPQEYKIEDLLRSILKQVRPNDCEAHEAADEEKLKEALSGCLKDQSYLIIMDNVWRKEVWDEVKAAFSDDSSNGSRILITTRSENVGSHASRSGQVHKVDFLCEDDSLELLCRRSLGEKKCPTKLEKFGRQLAKNSDGIPLAIVLLGDILARKKATEEATWSALADSTSRYLSFHGKGRRIAGSYHNLPRHLKTCFLYFGLFPEDCEIPARQLIQLWIAEGFVEEKKGTQKEMEDVGEEYLNELIDKSLIQVKSWRTDGGGVKTCCILKLLRDLCISAAEKQNLFLVLANGNHRQPFRRETQPLGFAVHAGAASGSLAEAFSAPCISNDCQQLRSLQCYASEDNSTTTVPWKRIYSNFTSLRVLNLGSIKVDRIPSGVKKLLYLQYLRVNAPNLCRVPRSVCKLWKLQTLDMRDSAVSTLPNGIWRMKFLRHLYFRSVSLPNPRGRNYDKALGRLQTLKGVRPDGVLRDLMLKAKFPDVTKLSISSSNKQDTSEFLRSLDHLYHLQSLKIVKDCQLPDVHAFPPTLTKITLKETNLEAFECMKTLEKLPNLHVLKLLRGSIIGREMNCNAGWFPQLHVLHLVETETETWKMGVGAMRNIQHLVIKGCVRLMTVPDLHPWMSTTLRDVNIFKPSAKLRETLQQLGNPDGCTVRIAD